MPPGSMGGPGLAHMPVPEEEDVLADGDGYEDVIDDLGSSVERMSIDREAPTPTAAANAANGNARHMAYLTRAKDDLPRANSVQ